MMWDPEGKRVEPSALGTLTPTEVLFEFEEPLTFACEDPDGQLLLAHHLFAEGAISRYLVAVTDLRILQELKAGRLDILSGLRQPRCWIADVAGDGKVASLWLIPFGRIPGDHLPAPGVMISPELEPAFRIRLIGPGVGPGKTSAADIRMAAQAAESGLRGLARIALDVEKRAGHVSRAVHDFSDLPYRFTRAASFEIAFGRPEGWLAGMDDVVFREMGKLFDLGLLDLRRQEESPSPNPILSAEQTLQLHEAIKAFTPPTRGGVERIEVGGVLVESFGGSKILTRDDRARATSRIKAVRKLPRIEEPFRVAGVVEEADQGEYAFTLRQLDPRTTPAAIQAAEIRFKFEDHLFDAVMDAFNSTDRMVVVGERIGAVNKALDIQLETASADSASEHDSGLLG